MLVAVRRNLLPIFSTLLGLGLIGLLIYGVSHQAANRTLDELVAKDERPLAPDATHAMPILGSTTTSSLAAYKGKVVLLNLWASWCSTCQEEAPLLARTQSTMLKHNSTILGVTDEDAAPDSQSFVAKYHLTYPNLRDTDEAFVHAYGTVQLPESFIVNRQGRIVAIERGPIGSAFVNRALTLAETT